MVLVGLIAIMFIPNLMKTREVSDSFPWVLRHAIGLLEENTNLLRCCTLPHTTPECIFDPGQILSFSHHGLSQSHWFTTSKVLGHWSSWVLVWSSSASTAFQCMAQPITPRHPCCELILGLLLRKNIMALKWEKPGAGGTYPTGLSCLGFIFFPSLGHRAGVNIKLQISQWM